MSLTMDSRKQAPSCMWLFIYDENSKIYVRCTRCAHCHTSDTTSQEPRNKACDMHGGVKIQWVFQKNKVGCPTNSQQVIASDKHLDLRRSRWNRWKYPPKDKEGRPKNHTLRKMEKVGFVLQKIWKRSSSLRKLDWTKRVWDLWKNWVDHLENWSWSLVQLGNSDSWGFKTLTFEEPWLSRH